MNPTAQKHRGIRNEQALHTLYGDLILLRNCSNTPGYVLLKLQFRKYRLNLCPNCSNTQVIELHRKILTMIN